MQSRSTRRCRGAVGHPGDTTGPWNQAGVRVRFRVRVRVGVRVRVRARVRGRVRVRVRLRVRVRGDMPLEVGGVVAGFG